MKKILALMLCIIIVCAMPLMVFAEGEESAPVEDGEVVTEDLPAVEETLPEGENEGVEDTTPEESAPEDVPPVTAPEDNVPENTTPEQSIKDQAKTVSDKIAAWVVERIELISALVTIVLTTFYHIVKNKALSKSIVVLNNNAVKAAESSSKSIEGASKVVTGYSTEITTLLEEFRKTAEDNQKLEAALANVESYLKNAKAANIELSNELAELLVLSNIPNAKKDELYSRHRTAVALIAEPAEVTEDDREEA